MPKNVNKNMGGCCGPPIHGLRRLTFPDGTQVGVTGLDAAMEELRRAGRPADERAGAEIMAELASENYLAPAARQDYEVLFRKEYHRYLRAKAESGKEQGNGATAGNAGSRKAREFGLWPRTGHRKEDI